MFNKEKTVYLMQGGLMVCIFISPFFFSGYKMPLIELKIYEIASLLLGFSGILLSVLAIKAMGDSLETKPRPKVDGKLITKFPFSVSRNPMYIAVFLLTLSWSLAHKSLVTLLFAFMLQLILVLKVDLEESFLEEKFKDSYAAYKEKVPKWLFFRFRG